MTESLLYFDPEIGGHHPIHLRSLLEGWQELGSGELIVSLHPDFPETHPGIWREIKALSLPGVEMDFFRREEIRDLFSGGLVRQSFRLWKVLQDALRVHRPRVCFVNMLDLMILPLALGLKPGADTQIAGTLFRPTLHYHCFRLEGNLSPGERIRRIQKKLLLRRALKNPALKAVFSLDPYAVDSIQQLTRADKARFLPEPFLHPGEPDEESLWKKLKMEPGRTSFLVFGVLSRRKGIFRILEAVDSLSEELSRQTAVIFAGKIDSAIRGDFLRKVKETQQRSRARIAVEDAFLSNAQAASLFAGSDVILGMYERSFVGSSGLLIWAASARKPLLVSSYGMIGKLVSDRKFGSTADPENPDEIAAAMALYIQGHPPGIDQAAMAAYARENTAKGFAEAILHSVLDGNHPDDDGARQR